MSARTLRPSRTKLHQFLVSAGEKEAALGTARAVDAALLMNRAIFPSHGAEIVTDEGKVSGKSGVSKTQAVTTDIMLDFGIDQLTFFELGFLLAYTFGPRDKTPIYPNDAQGTAGSAQKDASKYLKFIFTPPGAKDIDVTPFTLEHWKNKKDASRDLARYSGGYIDSLNLEMNRGGNRLVNASGQMGFKKYETWVIGDQDSHALSPTNYAFPPAQGGASPGFIKALNEKAMNAACGDVWLDQAAFKERTLPDGSDSNKPKSLKSGIGGNSIPVKEGAAKPSLKKFAADGAVSANDADDASEAVQTARLNWSNNVSRGYRPGGKSNISLARRTDPTRTLDLSLEYATQAEAQAFHRQADYAFQWNIVGDPIVSDPAIKDTTKDADVDRSGFGFSLIIPRMRIATYDESEDEGIVNMDLGFTIMDPLDNTPALYAVLWLQSPTNNTYAFGGGA